MGIRTRIQAIVELDVPTALLRAGVRAAFRRCAVREGELSITLMGDADIARLNRQYLEHEGPTDVISFPLYEEPEPVLGDVYIGVEQAARAARAHGIPLDHELLRLAVHGTLHVLGHEHPEDETRTRSAMWRLQEEIVTTVLEKSA